MYVGNRPLGILHSTVGVVLLEVVAVCIHHRLVRNGLLLLPGFGGWLVLALVIIRRVQRVIIALHYSAGQHQQGVGMLLITVLQLVVTTGSGRVGYAFHACGSRRADGLVVFRSGSSGFLRVLVIMT